MQYKKLNSPRNRLNTKSQFLLSSIIFNTQNYGCWNYTTLLLPTSVMYTSSKSWNRTLILCTLLLPRVNSKIVAKQKLKQSGNECDEETALIFSILLQLEFSFPDCAVSSRKNTTRQPGHFKEELLCTEMLILVARRTAVMMLLRTRLNSVAKASTNTCQNELAMALWTNTAASGITKLILIQQTEVSVQTITLLLRMNKSGKDSPASIQQQL